MTTSRAGTGETALYGNQSPRLLISPSYAYTDGPLCAELSSSYGMRPDPWQQNVLDPWLGCTENGKYVSGTVCLSVPRQNGKNGILEMVEVFKMAVQGRKVLHTAHEVKTARKAFKRLSSFFDGPTASKELSRMVVEIRRTNGQEAIFLDNGGSVEFIARSKSSGLGFTVDDVVCDEAQILDSDAISTLRPTMAAAPSGNPQLILVGTPPRPGAIGTVFADTRRKSIKGTAKRTTWVEWSVEEVGDVRDRERWYDTNPALGYRLQEDVIEDELSTMDDDVFARERLGWWSDKADGKLVSEAEWAALVCEPPDGPGKTCFSVRFTPDNSAVAIAASFRPKGTEFAYCELVDMRPKRENIDWIVDYMVERKREIALLVVDGKAGKGTLVRKLLDAGFPPKALQEATPGIVSEAAAMTLTAIQDGYIGHSGQPLLDESVKTAVERKIGKDGWGWGGQNPAPIEAVSNAYWAVMTTKRNPGGSKII